MRSLEHITASTPFAPTYTKWQVTTSPRTRITRPPPQKPRACPSARICWNKLLGRKLPRRIHHPTSLSDLVRLVLDRHDAAHLNGIWVGTPPSLGRDGISDAICRRVRHN